MELALITRAIYPLHGYGGMERHCYDWTLSMSEAGCVIHVVTTSPVDASCLKSFPANVRFYFLPGKSARSVARRITQYPRWVQRVRNFLPNFLNDSPIKGVYAHGLAANACINVKIPVVYNPHGMEEFKTSGLKFVAYTGFRRMSREAAESATRILATDQALIPEIMNFLRVPQTKIALIPNAAPMKKTSSQETISRMKAQMNIEKADPLLLTVGRLEANKGMHVLLKALSMATNLPSGWKLVIAGSGSELIDLQKLAEGLRLQQNVKFAGELSDDELTALYEVSDLFLNPTLYEGSSLVTLEAMNHGLPIVASNTGGLPDKVDPKLNGWLVAPNNPEALAQAITDAVQRRNEWQKMGEASAGIVNEKYSWEKITPRFVALFENPSYF